MDGSREARLEKGEGGIAPAGEGWFVLNVAEAQAMHTEDYGAGAIFEAEPGEFPEFGINVRRLKPGVPASAYHRESAQEAYLVLSGECTLVVEDEERTLRKGDFVHLPAGAAHVLVGAGEGESSVLMVGARGGDKDVIFPVSETAARYGASVAEETRDRGDAYSGMSAPPRFTPLGEVPW